MITQENTLAFAVEDEIIRQFIEGECSRITVSIDDDIYPDLLENVDGNLLLDVEELPDTFHGCYYYNGGKFPYLLKKGIENIMLVSESRQIVGRLVGTEFTPGTRFRFGSNPGEPSVVDPEGDNCIWDVSFELEPSD